MHRIVPKFGEGILAETLNTIGSYVLVTMEEPWKLLNKMLTNKPSDVILNQDMRIENLEELEKDRISTKNIVGFGGGTSSDTAKYLSWRWDIPLIISPSIISVDAWLCRSIAIRAEHKVKYVGNAEPRQILIDFSLIKAGPKFLNWAGVSDIVSITTALGDWKIARDNFGEKYDRGIFNEAKKIVDRLIPQAEKIHRLNNDGIKVLVKGQLDEVILCERWGNARPEEGSEHFLAYCLEELTGEHYIHGNLIALNTLVVLKLQRENAIYDVDTIKDFFEKVGVIYCPLKQGIKRKDYKRALETTPEYIRSENLSRCLWSLGDVFDQHGEYSIEGILDWAYTLS